MTNLYDRASEAAEAISGAIGGETPELAVVLGSGLDALASRLDGTVEVSYREIPHFPEPSVAGHAGRVTAGRLGGVRLLALRGRFHHYEGHELSEVTFPIRVLQRMGIGKLVLTAATGGIDPEAGPGAIVCLRDHLNLLGANPLRGPHDERFGPRFPDMTEVYSRNLRRLAEEVSRELGLPFREGVYACVSGPSYETPAEVRMLRALGADVVGMSTVPEAIVARQGGMEVLGLAVVSNWAAGLSPEPLSHAEVLEVGRRVSGRLAELIEGICGRLSTGKMAGP